MNANHSVNSDIMDEILVSNEEEMLDRYIEKLMGENLSADDFERSVKLQRDRIVMMRHHNPFINDNLPVPATIPEGPESTSPLANIIGRSNFFAISKRGKPEFLESYILKSPAGTELIYTGNKLRTSDGDFFLAICEAGKGVLPGMEIFMSRTELLRKAGYSSKHFGQSDYKFAQQAVENLASAQVFTKVIHQKTNQLLIQARFSLLSYIYDAKTRKYAFSIPSAALKMFAGKFYGYVNMERRRKLPKQSQMARWLSNFAVSHYKGLNRFTVNYLLRLSDYDTKPSVFYKRIKKAIAELIEIGEFKNGATFDREPIGDSIITWVRNTESETQSAGK